MNLWDTVKNTLVPARNIPRTFVSRFHYPRTGGIGHISECYARKIREMGGIIHLNTKIIKIILDDEAVSAVEYYHMDKGQTSTEQFDHVFSTISMKDLVSIIEPGVPETVREHAERLLFNSVIFVYLLINKPTLSSNQWIYIPEKRLLNNRVTEFKNFNRENVPEDTTMICAEITCRTNDDVWDMLDSDLAEQVVLDLKHLQLLRNGEVMDHHVVRMKEGYPIYDLHYREKVQSIREYLGQIPNLSYFGRNAMFRYNNMDHSIDMGITAARDIRTKSRVEEIATEKRYFG
jgi:protoporphyrinogen oxidase